MYAISPSSNTEKNEKFECLCDIAIVSLGKFQSKYLYIGLLNCQGIQHKQNDNSKLMSRLQAIKLDKFQEKGRRNRLSIVSSNSRI